jgi:hypothetical protein
VVVFRADGGGGAAPVGVAAVVEAVGVMRLPPTGGAAGEEDRTPLAVQHVVQGSALSSGRVQQRDTHMLLEPLVRSPDLLPQSRAIVSGRPFEDAARHVSVRTLRHKRSLFCVTR